MSDHFFVCDENLQVVSIVTFSYSFAYSFEVRWLALVKFFSHEWLDLPKIYFLWSDHTWKGRISGRKNPSHAKLNVAPRPARSIVVWGETPSNVSHFFTEKNVEWLRIDRGRWDQHPIRKLWRKNNSEVPSWPNYSPLNCWRQFGLQIGSSS